MNDAVSLCIGAGDEDAVGGSSPRRSKRDGSDTARRDSLSYMGNLIYHVPTGWPIGIYGGAGIGAVTSEIYANNTHDSSTVLGWQAIGGIDYAISPDTKMFAEYRYQNAHDANLAIPGVTRVGDTTNNLSVGVKFDL